MIFSYLIRRGWMDILTLLILAAGLHQLVWWMAAGVEAIR